MMNKFYLGLDQATSNCGVALLNENMELLDYTKLFEKSTKTLISDKVMVIHNTIKQMCLKHSKTPSYEVFVINEDNSKYIPHVNAAKTQNYLIGFIKGAYLNNNISISPYQWRKMIWPQLTKNNIKRVEWKIKAISKVEELYGIKVCDDIAEAILIARVGIVLKKAGA